MKLGLIALYFLSIFLILSGSRLLATNLAFKGYTLEQIKQKVWNSMIGFILVLTLVIFFIWISI